jgi:hypothetical protein
MSKFVLAVLEEETTGDRWTEDFFPDENTDPLKHVQSLINYFNSQPNGQLRRRLVVIRTKFPIGTKPPHHWIKINLMTIRGWHGFYDIYNCKNCGATAKKYGITPIVPDKLWKETLCKTI